VSKVPLSVRFYFDNFRPPTNKVLYSERLTAHNSLASYHLVHGDNKPFKTYYCAVMHMSNLVACLGCDEAFLLVFFPPFLFPTNALCQRFLFHISIPHAPAESSCLCSGSLDKVNLVCGSKTQKAFLVLINYSETFGCFN